VNLRLTLAALLLCTLPVAAQSAPAGGRVVLVLPFENRSGDASLDWLGESFPAIINPRLASAGLFPITRDDRLFALDHLGLPLDFKPSRATTIRIAQTLDADYVISGSFTTSGDASARTLQASARLLRVGPLHLEPALTESQPLSHLLDLQNILAWDLALSMDPTANITRQGFIAASAGLQINAFENYVRGVTDRSPNDAARHLASAVQIQPDYSAALLALGKVQFSQEHFELAAATLARIPANDPLALEAGFYRGLSHFNSANYAAAQQDFAFVSSTIPLPEVINNEGVAFSRQHKDAVALFQQAAKADPLDADYRYNLAASLFRRKDYAAALPEADKSLALRPNDADAAALRSTIAAALKGTPPPDGFDPLERIRRSYSEAGYRQAAAALDQIRALQSKGQKQP